jgi:hypothetical protein
MFFAFDFVIQMHDAQRGSRGVSSIAKFGKHEDGTVFTEVLLLDSMFDDEDFVSLGNEKMQVVA